MAGEIETLHDLLPGRAAAFVDKGRQRQELAFVRLRFGGADSAARLRAHRDEIVIASGHGTAVQVEPDTQGRILIPQRLRDFAGLERDVIIIGAIDRIEIWNAARWQVLPA